MAPLNPKHGYVGIDGAVLREIHERAGVPLPRRPQSEPEPKPEAEPEEPTAADQVYRLVARIAEDHARKALEAGELPAFPADDPAVLLLCELASKAPSRR